MKFCPNLVTKKFCLEIVVISKKKNGLHLDSVTYFSIFVPKSRRPLKKKKKVEILQLVTKFCSWPLSMPWNSWLCPNFSYRCPIFRFFLFIFIAQIFHFFHLNPKSRWSVKKSSFLIDLFDVITLQLTGFENSRHLGLLFLPDTEFNLNKDILSHNNAPLGVHVPQFGNPCSKWMVFHIM